MLAYVFWHWHSPQIDDAAYQERLIDFHSALCAHKPGGFQASRVLLAQQATWLARDAPTYEDWYLVENSAALDELNVGAVTGPRQEPHQRVAHWTEGGTAGLYRLHSGDASLAAVGFAARFNKAQTTAYSELYELLRAHETSDATNVWVRQMTLGPGPEFCVLSASRPVLADSLHALEIPLRQLWFGGGRKEAG